MTREEKQSKEDTVQKCPKCDEINMHYDRINRVWQCLSCGNVEEE